MSEEIVFDRSMIEGRFGQRSGQPGGGNDYRGRGGPGNQHGGGNGNGVGGGLNPRARSFFVSLTHVVS
jgi:hypothetical protein